MNTKIFTCRLETITPVHVGSGKLFRKGFDFEVNHTQLIFYDTAKIHRHLAQSGRQAMKAYEQELLGQNPSIENFLRKVGWRKDDFVRYRLNVSTEHVRDVKGQMKTGLGQPLIPGSSLKGALRTAILADYFDQHPDEEKRLFPLRDRQSRNKKQRAAEPIVKRVFGASPNEDAMRQVSVSDVAFARDALNLYEMKIANLTHNGYGFLNMFKKRNEHPDNWARATSILAEAIPAGVRSEPFMLSFDHFLQTRGLFHAALDKMPLDGEFFGAVEYHYRQLAEKEYEFFAKYGLQQSAQFYQKHILGREFEDDEVLLRVGWGGGWRFMTGDWVTETQLAQIRHEYRLGKREHPVFPKSRRLIVENHFPVLPLGWMVLHLEKFSIT